MLEFKKNKKNNKYNPKSIKGALAMFFKNNFPNLASDIILPNIIEEIISIFKKYTPKLETINAGELFYIGVDKDETPGYRKSLTETNMKPCVLSIVDDKDIEMKEKKVKAKEIKKSKLKRILINSHKQGVVLSNIDVARILNLSTSTVSKYIKEIEESEKISLPRRGTIHDLGPSVTHKVMIIKKHLLEHKSIEETMRETYHSKEAINRYIKDFERIQLLYKKNIPEDEMSLATNMSLHLIQEYVEIIRKIEEA